MSVSAPDVLPDRVVPELFEANVLCEARWNNVVLDIPPGNSLTNVKQEIFRLIEESFKKIWWETGTWIKTDVFNEKDFHQLVTLNISSDKQYRIVSWYRYALRKWLSSEVHTPVTNFFDIKDDFLRPDVSQVLELWTAWSNPFVDHKLQFLSFASTWDGLAALVNAYHSDYLVGKLTIPAQYHPKARDFAINYLENYSSPPTTINSIPKDDFAYVPSKQDMKFSSRNLNQDKVKITEILSQLTAGQEKYLPAMFPLYLSRLIPQKFHYIGTVQNGRVCESGIVVPMAAIPADVHESYKKSVEKFYQRFPNQEQISLWSYLKNH